MRSMLYKRQYRIIHVPQGTWANVSLYMKNNEHTNHLIIYDQNVDALAFAVEN